MRNNNKFSARQLIDKYAMYGVGFLGALTALVAAYFMPTDRESLVTGAGVLAFLTLMSGNVRSKLGVRLLGMVAAGICLLATVFMPDQGLGLITASGVIACLSILLTSKD